MVGLDFTPHKYENGLSKVMRKSFNKLIEIYIVTEARRGICQKWKNDTKKLLWSGQSWMR